MDNSECKKGSQHIRKINRLADSLLNTIHGDSATFILLPLAAPMSNIILIQVVNLHQYDHYPSSLFILEIVYLSYYLLSTNVRLSMVISGGLTRHESYSPRHTPSY